MHQDRQIKLCHYQSIYTTSMGFCSYRTEIRQFKILPTACFEQTAKYNYYIMLANISAYTVYTMPSDFNE